jgi:CelD/BcsL family acetyltransferase involved in cellulose biosynthesis
MKIDLLPDPDAVDAERWNGLLDRSRLPALFLTWQWQTAWRRAFTGGRPLQLLTASDDDGTLVGLLPLYEESPGCLRILGGVDVSDYLDVIAVTDREEEIWRAPPRPPRRSCPRSRRGAGWPRWSRGRTAARCWPCPRAGTTTSRA